MDSPSTKCCTECNREYTANPHSKNKRNFCSRSCWYVWRKKNKTAGGYPIRTRIETQCDSCGSLIYRKPSHKKTNKHNFCNYTCYHRWLSISMMGSSHPQWKGGGDNVPCNHCGQPVYRKHFDIHNQKYFFCNPKCYSLWVSTNRIGENHHLWKGGYVNYRGPNWHQQRELARTRDGNKCQICGMQQKKTTKKLPVHHILPFCSFNYIPGENDNYIQANQLTNLITLCPRCHRKAEVGKIPVPLPLI